MILIILGMINSLVFPKAPSWDRSCLIYFQVICFTLLKMLISQAILMITHFMTPVTHFMTQ